MVIGEEACVFVLFFSLRGNFIVLRPVVTGAPNTPNQPERLFSLDFLPMLTQSKLLFQTKVQFCRLEFTSWNKLVGVCFWFKLISKLQSVDQVDQIGWLVKNCLWKCFDTIGAMTTINNGFSAWWHAAKTHSFRVPWCTCAQHGKLTADRNKTHAEQLSWQLQRWALYWSKAIHSSYGCNTDDHQHHVAVVLILLATTFCFYYYRYNITMTFNIVSCVQKQLTKQLPFLLLVFVLLGRMTRKESWDWTCRNPGTRVRFGFLV